MEERYLEDKRAMDAASRELTIRLEADKTRLDEGVSHSERFLAAGMRRVADACHDAKHAVIEAERALKGLEAEGYRRAVDAVTLAVDELLALVESEDERLLWLESLRYCMSWASPSFVVVYDIIQFYSITQSPPIVWVAQDIGAHGVYDPEPSS